jgi:hypothetical protein
MLYMVWLYLTTLFFFLAMCTDSCHRDGESRFFYQLSSTRAKLINPTARLGLWEKLGAPSSCLHGPAFACLCDLIFACPSWPRLHVLLMALSSHAPCSFIFMHPLTASSLLAPCSFVSACPQVGLFTGAGNTTVFWPWV